MSEKLEIKQINEREIWHGRVKTFLIEENIIYVITDGDQTLESASMQIEINNRMSILVEGKINYLIDLNKAGKNSSEARQIWNQISEQENTNKIAMYGLHPVARVIASFAMGGSKRKNQRFFTTKEESLKWLLEKKAED